MKLIVHRLWKISLFVDGVTWERQWIILWWLLYNFLSGVHSGCAWMNEYKMSVFSTPNVETILQNIYFPWHCHSGGNCCGLQTVSSFLGTHLSCNSHFVHFTPIFSFYSNSFCCIYSKNLYCHQNRHFKAENVKGVHWRAFLVPSNTFFRMSSSSQNDTS